jgi:Flp pilus assembly protein TadG
MNWLAGDAAYSRDCSRRGQALLLATMSLFVLFGVMGLAVDLGWSYYRKQVAQTATDAAALAAAVVAENAAGNNTIVCGSYNIVCQIATACPAISGSPANNIQNGCLYAKANGFTNSGNQTLTMASSAAGTAPDPSTFTVLYTVTATAGETIPQLFSGLLGNTSGKITAQSTAEVVQLPIPDCIYVLKQGNVPNALVATGSNSRINAPNCGIAVNSSSASAFAISGNAPVTAGFIKIVGGYTNSGQIAPSPTPKTGQSVTADPLATLPAPPAPTTCDHANFNINQPPNATVEVYPGTYCGGINIGGQTSAHFHPGLYYVYGGGIIFQNNSSNDTGTDVVFFNTDGHGIPGLVTSNYAPIHITGQSNVNLSAPTTGTYAGILFYKDRLYTAPSTSNTDQIDATTQPILVGTLYFPGDNLNLTGQGGIGMTVGSNSPAIIADTINVNGGGAAITTSAGSSTRSKFAALVQ